MSLTADPLPGMKAVPRQWGGKDVIVPDAKNSELTFEELDAAIDYNPGEGTFIREINPAMSR